MRHILLIFVVIFVFFHFGNGAVSILKDSRNDKYPGKCYYDGDGENPPLILSPGDKTTIHSKCSQAHCNTDLSMSFFSCSLIGVPENCKISEMDKTKDYPGCCPELICP